ncbi:hypothetical protein ACTHR6_26495 [Ralstonia holmesii]|uniref:hypothetical protein n=1 Tax=Ralstonia TaxID=48736 RepID=UPI000A8E2248|nr:hypothetical protein [Ralstonia pickettii]
MSDGDKDSEVEQPPIAEIRAPIQMAIGRAEPESRFVTGKIAEQIGSGSHAKNSIVYRTIGWSFLAGGVFSLCVVFYSAFATSESPFSFKDVWSVFTPIITLALGYLFGKGDS